MKKIVVSLFLLAILSGAFAPLFAFEPFGGSSFGYVNLQAGSDAFFQTDLPLTVFPSAVKKDLPMVFFISGDGGWTDIDREISKQLSVNGFPVVGLDARKYFWIEKQPGQVAMAITNVLRHYLSQWNRSSFILVGYSFGACVAPFIASYFPQKIEDVMDGIYCLSPDETCDFKVHIADLLSLKTVEKYDVLGEIKKMASYDPVCLFGDQEDPLVREHFAGTGAKVATLPGDHHYNRGYKLVANFIRDDFQNREK
ncbi:MAG TPA: AcvB/VirJ family lysyl-phosphatidylglycerol hydrolase [Prolixibacteraceae bacterium]|nr:AcvB/VirJ family lysyl-phosphatidylglycerol hydrolase [Prolixibacteraceae bacterium]HPS12426.1 AcvB/VirJ family lysyl-phosphatidylglycerol hydrolase [Prolixibacteraceae bacterium]